LEATDFDSGSSDEPAAQYRWVTEVPRAPPNMDEGATITGERPLSKTMKTMTCRAIDSGTGRRGRQAWPTVPCSKMAAGNIFVLDVPAGKGSHGSPEKPKHSFGQLRVCSQASFPARRVFGDLFTSGELQDNLTKEPAGGDARCSIGWFANYQRLCILSGHDVLTISTVFIVLC
jgi:hypothetical protein